MSGSFSHIILLGNLGVELYGWSIVFIYCLPEAFKKMYFQIDVSFKRVVHLHSKKPPPNLLVCKDVLPTIHSKLIPLPTVLGHISCVPSGGMYVSFDLFSPPPRFPFKDKIYIYQNLPAFGVKFCEFWLIHTFMWLPPQSRYGMVPSSPQIPLDPFLAPSQFQPTDVSPVPTVLAFPGYPVNGIIQHIVFKTGFLRSIQHTWNSSTLLWVSAHHS